MIKLLDFRVLININLSRVVIDKLLKNIHFRSIHILQLYSLKDFHGLSSQTWPKSIKINVRKHHSQEFGRYCFDVNVIQLQIHSILLQINIGCIHEDPSTFWKGSFFQFFHFKMPVCTRKHF